MRNTALEDTLVGLIDPEDWGTAIFRNVEDLRGLRGFKYGCTMTVRNVGKCTTGHRHSPEGLNLQHYRFENSNLNRDVVEDDIVSAYRSFSIFSVEVG